MGFEVRLTAQAREDLLRLYEFLLDTDVKAAIKAEAAIERGLELLTHSPFTCRRASAPGADMRLRELVIGFGCAGYVALFEVEDSQTVTVLAIRHQREDDFH